MLSGYARAAALVCLVLAGCGGDDEAPGGSAGGGADGGLEEPEQVKGLPAGWTVERNEAQGFALGAPPGWGRGAECLAGGAELGPVTILCSPDKLVTLSVQADRTNEALELEPEAFASRTMEGLADSYEGLEPGKPEPFKAHYDGAAVSGQGRAVGSGVMQDVRVVVLRREGAANFTAVIAANAEKPTGPAVKLAEQALRELRSQPVGAPSG
jgi:hypothetical protein